MTLHRPSAAAIPARCTMREDCGTSCNITPAATAPLEPSAGLWTRDCAARWVATREEEQAVSTEAEGPVRPKVKAMRPAATAEDPAVKEKGPICVLDQEFVT